MRVFQTLAPEYDLKSALRHLFARGRQADNTTLQRELALRFAAGQVVLYARGRSALAAAIRHLMPKGKTEVAISGLTCFSVEQAVTAAGMKPVFVDANPRTLQFDAPGLKKMLQQHSNLGVVVIQNHLGIPVDIAPIEKLCCEHGIKLIEDLAHSAGATYPDGRAVGTVGDGAMLSFGRGKAIDVVNGGALLLRNSTLESRPTQMPSLWAQLQDRLYPLIGLIARSLYGTPVGKYIFPLAFKLRLATRSADGDPDERIGLPAWQAKLALAQLRSLDKTAKRRANQSAKATKPLAKNHFPDATSDGAAPLRVPVLVRDRAELLARLAEKGFLLNDTWYDVPVGPPRLFGQSQYQKGSCPVAEKLATHLLNIPTHTKVTDADLKEMTKIINQELL